MTKSRQPYPYEKGDKVRDIWTGEEFTVKQNIGWQPYAGPSTADYTITFEPTESQPTPWNKSRNLEPLPKVETEPDCHGSEYDRLNAEYREEDLDSLMSDIG